MSRAVAVTAPFRDLARDPASLGKLLRLLRHVQLGAPYPWPTWDQTGADLRRGTRYGAVWLVWTPPMVLWHVLPTGPLLEVTAAGVFGLGLPAWTVRLVQTRACCLDGFRFRALARWLAAYTGGPQYWLGNSVWSTAACCCSVCGSARARDWECC